MSKYGEHVYLYENSEKPLDISCKLGIRENFCVRDHEWDNLFLWDLIMVPFLGTRCIPKIETTLKHDPVMFLCLTGIKNELNP